MAALPLHEMPLPALLPFGGLRLPADKQLVERPVHLRLRIFFERQALSAPVPAPSPDDGGYYLRNYSSRRVNELFARNAPASEMSRLEEEERSLSQECEVGMFQLIDTIFREQSEPSRAVRRIVRFLGSLRKDRLQAGNAS